MIKGVHTMFYTSEPEELRAFFRDKFGLPSTDVGEGWLLFDLPDAELGCHPTQTDRGDMPSGTAHISFYCDDIEATVSELKKRGVEFVGGIDDHGYGLVTQLRAPGDFTIQLYEPRYARNPVA